MCYLQTERSNNYLVIVDSMRDFFCHYNLFYVQVRLELELIIISLFSFTFTLHTINDIQVKLLHLHPMSGAGEVKSNRFN